MAENYNNFSWKELLAGKSKDGKEIFPTGVHNSDIGESSGRMYDPNSVTPYPSGSSNESDISNTSTEPVLTDRQKNAVWMEENNQPFNPNSLPESHPKHPSNL